MYSFSLFPLISKPNQVFHKTATLLDHIWTTEIELNIGNYIIHTDISDDFPVVSEFKQQNLRYNAHEYISNRIITNTSLALFSNKLAQINWSNILDSTCPNESYELFYSKFNDLYKKFFPVKNIRINPKHERSPHIIPGLKYSIRNKNRLERLANK